MKVLLLTFLILTITQVSSVRQDQMSKIKKFFKNNEVKPISLPEIGFRGYIPVKYGTYYYWGFHAHKNHKTAPLFVWLTEGPGVSILLPIFYGNGPFSIDEDLNISSNIYAWNKLVNILFIDCPLGTGLSKMFPKYKNFKMNEIIESEQLIQFLKKFFQKHKEFEGRNLIFGGESYGTEQSSTLVYKILKEKQLPKNRIVGVFQSSLGLNLPVQTSYLPTQL